MCLHLAAYCRGALVILPRYRPELAIAALAAERITAFAGGPTVFTGMLAHPDLAAARFPSLRVSYSGSAPLPEEVLRRWEAATGCPILEGYGQTEAGPVLSFNPQDGRRKPGSVGIAVPGTAIEIVDTTTGTTVLPVGERGEIRASGPQIMRGYRNLPEETAAALREGWLYTGDIGELDGEGYLFIRDRKKDMAIVGGYNVYPREIDEVLFAHPDVLEVAAIGVPDAYRGEIIRAFVVPRPGRRPSGEELLAHCRANLAKYKVPASIELVAALPKTSVGKIDKKALRLRDG
jgi:long-chain acyl-CoA synthetase